MDKNKIGASIKRIRLEKGISQTYLANQIGVTHAAISFWENGVNIPNVLDCCKLADYFNITIDELIDRQ